MARCAGPLTRVPSTRTGWLLTETGPRFRAIVPGMASGGPGDHWQTDLLTWNLPAFGEPLDSLLREIYRYGGEHALSKEPWPETLGRAWSRYERSESDDAELRQRITSQLRVLRPTPGRCEGSRLGRSIAAFGAGDGAVSTDGPGGAVRAV